MLYEVTKNAIIQTYKIDAGVTPVPGGNDIEKRRIGRLVAGEDHTFEYAADATAPYAGITKCAGKIGDLIDLQQSGLAILEAGEAVAVGDPVIAMAGGKGGTGTGFTIGTAVTAAAADEDLFVVQIDQGQA